ncbi:DNA repair protein Rtt107, putative [Talaromyces stipitatus ATCC 10500]|uniref:DNA repair protein Rtt107, putative n=1 Tax=Talaromyces stipitatus (strain ATCC 10500 / CBS 375.48 / QM 6759 / NRRL 1006) TaxID=441959 RepID=B8LWH2_TALSN|nr:DNA repair protein Rtt107, putative [Talaromyces stipitatus ATCC 10500]EED24283.1 DNA repair protein Rtt107, putative [Talaromyces stipitatus ATCC 10500]
MTEKQKGRPQLLSDCKICVARCNNLEEDAVMQLDILISEHGGEAVIHEEPAPFPPVEQFTHIISLTADFPAYQSACDAMIPVVKPQWLQASIAKGKLANPRQFSPDPRLFFSDVVVTCGDIPDGDKDAIIGGVIAMGGLYSPRLTFQVTHLVDLSMESDKAKLVVSKNLGAKIVLPHWFDDCLKLGRRIDERPYTLPNPEILNAGPDIPVRTFGNAAIVGASTPEPTALPTPSRSPNHHRSLSVLEGKHIMLSSDLGIGKHLLDSIEDLIKQGNGTVTKDLGKADMFICRYREGFEYRTASRWNKDVGNLSWLFYLITHNKWTSPLRRLLHYPVHRDGVPGFQGFRISLSNYVGEARAYLENLIQAAGAECTKTLKTDNTHLITAHDKSEKCAAAKEWGLQVVNHLWLEESYAKWKMLPVSDPRYTRFPPRTNLGEVVGQTELDKAVLERNFFPADSSVDQSRVMQQKDQNIAANTEVIKTISPQGQTKSVTKSSPAPSKTTATTTPHTSRSSCKTSNTADAKTPIISRFLADEKENVTPSTTSSRKSKEAAAARIHDIAPDIALYEKEKKRVGGVVYGGRRKTDPDLIVPANNKKRRSAEPEEEDDAEEEKETKRQKKVKPPVAMHLMITGFQRWVGNLKQEDTDKRHLRNLGIAITQDAKKCTHLAAPSILRTPKFVSALAYAPVVVHIDYVTECLAKDELLDPSDFALVDKITEKKVGFNLAATLERAKTNKNKLLRDYRICCVETIRGGFDAFKSIAEANGGECTLFRGRVSMNDHRRRDPDSESDEEEDHLMKNDVFLVSGEEPEHVKVWPRFRQMVLEAGKTPRIVNVNWLLDIAMSQEIGWKDEYEYKTDVAF